MKLRDYISYLIISVVLTAGLSSCSREEPLGAGMLQPGAEVIPGEPFLLTGSVNVPDEFGNATRGNLGETPAKNLKLTILEFSKGSNSSNSFLHRIYHAEIIDQTDVKTGTAVRFTVPLVATNEPRILHLMLADDYKTCDFGSEADVLPTITVSNDKEAYWNRVEFPDGYVDNVEDLGEGASATLRDDVIKRLTNVPMIRNFAKITVSSATPDFEPYSFELVSVPTAGTIAPYDAATMSVPQLLSDADDNIDRQMLPYSKTAATYGGILPANAGFRNLANSVGVGDTNTRPWTNAAKYIYEHPFNSLNYTYMIVKGMYKRTNKLGYYRIDLGALDDSGIFKFYNLIRNYHYRVVINSVSASGAATPSEAISGPVCNNISFSVDAINMRNVSDGENMLWVNETDFIFTQEDPLVFRYRYLKDVHADNPAERNDVPKIIGLETGEVVRSFTEPTTYTDEQGAKWMEIEITPNTPTAQTTEQTFTVVDGNGLGRTISLVLHTPWSILEEPAYRAPRVYEGELNIPPDNNVSYTRNVVSSDVGKSMTVYFNLPDGLPEGMFPLQFRLECNPQDVENNPVGTLVVSTGPSLFEENNGAPAISFIKTVTWLEYNYLYSNSTGNDIDVSKSDRNSYHTIRCRLRTINVRKGTNTIMIHNPYFYNTTVTFTRK